MKKIPSLFIRDYEKVITSFNLTHTSTNMYGGTGVGGSINRYTKGRFLATEQVTPGCEWVINGEGVATRKWDGTAVNIAGGSVYRRYDAKNGKTPPDGFIPCQEPDPITGHWPGWVRIDHMSDKGQDKWIWEAVFNTFPGGFTKDRDGTYEAIGPKINGNPDRRDKHELRRHGDVAYENVIGITQPRSFKNIRHFLECESEVEGIVFHHQDGRMCKVKRSDFGLQWPIK